MKIKEKKVEIFGFVIEEDARRSFEELSKIYREKGGSFEIFNFFPGYAARPKMKPKSFADLNIFKGMALKHDNPMRENYMPMNAKTSINNYFSMNSMNCISSSIARQKK